MLNKRFPWISMDFNLCCQVIVVVDWDCECVRSVWEESVVYPTHRALKIPLTYWLTSITKMTLLHALMMSHFTATQCRLRNRWLWSLLLSAVFTSEEHANRRHNVTLHAFFLLCEFCSRYSLKRRLAVVCRSRCSRVFHQFLCQSEYSLVGLQLCKLSDILRSVQ